MASISQNTIDLIKDSADIVDVISEFVPLQNAGKNMKGLCPFHSEKTPSFFVSKERQIFNCFGCGKKGNVITFIQEYKHLSFVESLHYLADRYHVDIEFDSKPTNTNQVDNLYKANAKALDFFALNLLNLDHGKPALDYLIGRGLDVQTIETFEIGYAPKSSKSLFEQLKNDFQPLDLLNASLINRGENDYYDLFRNRIMFPIRDETEKIIGFSGRVFGENDNPAKYVNTAQTEIFSKSTVLYNLHRALPHIRQKHRVILMEGYMDVIKAYIAGAKETVCSMGTQLTVDQALKLRKYTENVIICYDGDRAGKEATYKAIKLLEDAKLNVSIAVMPDGMDPDEFISKYPNFNEFLDNGLKDQYEFVYQMIVKNKDLTIPAEIEKAKNQLFDFFAKTSGTIRDIYFNKFASDSFINLEVLKGDYRQTQINNRITANFKNVAEKKTTLKKCPPMFLKAENVIINYYIHDKYYRDIIDSKFNFVYFKNSDNLNFILTAMEINKTYVGEDFFVAMKSSLADDIYRQKLDQLLFDEAYNYTVEEFDACVNTLAMAKIEDEINFLEEEAAKCNQNIPEEKTKYIEYYMEIKELNRKKMNLRSEGRKNGKTGNN